MAMLNNQMVSGYILSHPPSINLNLFSNDSSGLFPRLSECFWCVSCNNSRWTWIVKLGLAQGRPSFSRPGDISDSLPCATCSTNGKLSAPSVCVFHHHCSIHHQQCLSVSMIFHEIVWYIVHAYTCTLHSNIFAVIFSLLKLFAGPLEHHSRCIFSCSRNGKPSPLR